MRALLRVAGSGGNALLWGRIPRCLAGMEPIAVVGLPCLLLLSAILLALWSLAVPIFEAPDEPHHWQYARYLHDHWRLPIYGPTFVEANSPPLYYLLIAPLATGSDLPSTIVIADSSGALRSPFPPRLFQRPDVDFRKYAPLRLARLLTAGMSVLSVLFCYLTGAEASGEPMTGLLAAGLVAFLPQFTFRGMNISNDALVTLLSTVAVYLVVRLIRRGFSWPTAVIAATAIGLAFLSKPTAMFLVAPFAVAVLSEHVHWRTRLTRLSPLAVALVISLPWLIRNQLLYGDVLASRAMLTAVSSIVDLKPLFSAYFLTTFPSVLAESLTGVFGWMNLWMPKPVYWSYGLLAALAATGLLRAAGRGKLDRRLMPVLVTVPVLNLMVTIYINLTFTQPQGRYLFPALSAIAVLVAMGLQNLPRWSWRAGCVLVGISGLANLYTLGTVIVPAYWTL